MRHFHLGSPIPATSLITTATSQRTQRPGPPPPTIQQADPHHHTGFIGPQEPQSKSQGSPLSLTPSLSGGPQGLAECSPLQSWLPVLVVLGLPELGSFRVLQVLDPGST
jgi:hypothetical protein